VSRSKGNGDGRREFSSRHELNIDRRKRGVHFEIKLQGMGIIVIFLFVMVLVFLFTMFDQLTESRRGGEKSIGFNFNRWRNGNRHRSTPIHLFTLLGLFILHLHFAETSKLRRSRIKFPLPNQPL